MKTQECRAFNGLMPLSGDITVASPTKWNIYFFTHDVALIQKNNRRPSNRPKYPASFMTRSRTNTPGVVRLPLLASSRTAVVCFYRVLVHFLSHPHHVYLETPDLDKIMQRFVSKPVRVTLATLLGLYRAVMRLSAITDVLDDAIEKKIGDLAEGQVNAKVIDAPLPKISERLSSVEDIESTGILSGGLLIRELLLSPLQQVVSSHVSRILSMSLVLCYHEARLWLNFIRGEGLLPKS